MEKKTVSFLIIVVLFLTNSFIWAQSSPSKVGTTDDDRGINYNNGPCIDRTPNGTVMCIWGTKENHNNMILWTTYDDLFGIWNLPQVLDEGTPERHTPALVADDNNHFHATWSKNYRIYYAQYDGLQWSTPVQVPNESAPWDTVNANKNSIIIGSDGKIWIAWSTYRHNDNENEYLFVSYSEDNGANWSDPDTLAKDMHPGIVSSYFCVPHLAAGPDGIIGVTYREKNTDVSALYQLYLQEYDGSSWSDPELISFFHDSIDCYQASIAYDSQGKRHIVFYTDETDWSSVDKGQIYYTSSEDGKNWTIPVAITADPDGIADYPAISIGENNAFYVVYLQNNYDTGVGIRQYFAITSADRGSTWSEPIQFSNAEANVPLRSASIGKHPRIAGIGGTNFEGGADILMMLEDATETDGYSVFYGRIPWVITTGVESNSTRNLLPDNDRLLQNYPNPFNPDTRIEFQLKAAGKVQLKVYNTKGEEVLTLIDDEMPEGFHHVIFNASNFATGIYFYKLFINDYVSTKKMILVK